MNSIKKILNYLSLSIIVLILSSWLSVNYQKTQTSKSLMVVANINNVTELSFKEFKGIMRGEKQRWKNGPKVEIALMKTSTPTGAVTAEKVYQMSVNQLNKYWLAQVFQGRVQAPQFFTSEADLIEYIERTPGAIGVITSSSERVDFLKIDGKTSL